MDGFTSRPVLTSDAPALLEIELAAERAEPAQHFVDLVRIREELAQPGIDLEQGSIAVLSGESIVGVGLLQARPAEESWKAGLFGGVLPEFRRRGIGRMILDGLQDKALALRARAGQGDLPGELMMWVGGGRASAAAFAAAAGFSSRRYFFEMRADLAQDVTTPSVDGIEIRAWSPADDDGARLAYNEAFADHWGSTPMTVDRWRTSFAGSAFFRPEFSRVALADGTVVGFVMVAEFPAATEANGHRTGYVDRVGSVRSVRGRGVAAAMLTDSMRAQRESGCRYAELGVDADSPTGAGRLYERLGYVLLHTNQVLGLDF
ncbi:GNAT family N-acetyltransferase [Nakamurella sp. PAMC28650]|jgi:mycothiol synthase|uniref:GNAT family N-acetyltransferase n=1 Tax=Nakamurella sp. PAMC28650 TaxID=2762325 RepID=UPI00164E4C27|nr:GNAT family N-acetyltransferase [Nakamurella sp. PAMC28650]QNK80089.1 GNAT family N-acetyltransferase [Nakamurella sp. PAMC28650]